MATKTAGTLATTTLTAVQFSHDPNALSNADFATIAAGIFTDIPTAGGNAAGRIYEGLGIASLESQLRPDQAIEQIVGLRKLGITGYVFFDLSRPLRDEILPFLRLGVMKE